MAARKFSSALIRSLFEKDLHTKMAGRLVLSCLRNPYRMSIRLHSELVGPPINFKYGKREIVGHGMNGEAAYMDLQDFPLPAIRFREITPDLQVLRDKEKGDWKKLSIEEKKMLYRTSFCQTFAELNAPTGEWKSILGCALLYMSLALWMFTWVKLYVSPPLPSSFSEESQLAQLDRMRKLDVNPIHGLNRRV